MPIPAVNGLQQLTYWFGEHWLEEPPVGRAVARVARAKMEKIADCIFAGGSWRSEDLKLNVDV